MSESLLTEDLTLSIRALVLEGEKYKDIQSKLGILPTTWDQWVYKDYRDFRKNLRSWKQERLLKKSEILSEEILDMNHGEGERVDKELLRIKQKESELVRTTVGKNDGWSTKGDDALNKIADKAILSDDQFNRIIRARAEKLNSEEGSTGRTN